MNNETETYSLHFIIIIDSASNGLPQYPTSNMFGMMVFAEHSSFGHFSHPKNKR